MIPLPAGIFSIAGQAGGEVTLPIKVGDSAGLKITAAALHLTYDPDILTPVGVTVEGTIAADWDVAYETGRTGARGARRDAVTLQQAGEGHIVIALAGSRELSGSGTLVNVIFMVSSEVGEGQASPIQLSDISFSSGDPAEVNAHAEFIVGEPGEAPQQPHIKWSQPPIEIDPNVDAPPVFCGWDEAARSTQGSGQPRQWRMDADDFHCLGPIPITRIRWWGGYKRWDSPEPPDSQPEAWHIGFWANQVPGLTPDQLYLERLVWSLEIPNERVHREPAGLDEFPESLPQACFVYEVGLEPNEWFHQAEFASNENVLWISITAIYPPDAQQINMWGWKTRPHVWRDGAVMPAIMGEWPTYDERLFPGRIYPIENSNLCGERRPYDLCFELLTDEPWVKWDQPFTGVCEWPYYADVESQGTSIRGQENIGRLVADDWVCERNTPVIAAAWWGSYIGHGYEACQCEPALGPPRPDYFLLTISTNVGPDGQTDYGRPGDVIWQYRAYDYDEVLVGYDRHPEGKPNEPVFRYSVRLPEDSWFRQSAADGMYWFSVAAVYTDPLPPIMYPWGWTNHPYTFGSTALSVSSPQTSPVWDPLYDQTGERVDMSFTLYTVPQGPPEGAQELAEYVRDTFLGGAFSGETLWMTPGPLDETFVARDTDPGVPDLPFPGGGRWWLVMIDDHPLANWGHAVRWIFVKEDLSQSSDAYDRQFWPGVYADFGRGERVPFFHVDLPLEGLGLYNTSQENNEIYTPAELAADTANAQVRRLFMILDQCFSGEFLSIATDGKHANSAVYVAATASEPSYGRQYMELWEQSNPKTTTMNAMHPPSLVPPLAPPSICIKLPCTSTPGMAEGTTGNGDMSLCVCTFN